MSAMSVASRRSWTVAGRCRRASTSRATSSRRWRPTRHGSRSCSSTGQARDAIAASPRSPRTPPAGRTCCGAEGVERGDRVLVLCGKTLDWHPVMLGGAEGGRGRDPLRRHAPREGSRVPCRAFRRAAARRRPAAEPEIDADAASSCDDAAARPLPRRGAEPGSTAPGLGADRGDRARRIRPSSSTRRERRRTRRASSTRTATASRSGCRPETWLDARRRTTSSGAPPARAGRSRSGTCCSGRGAWAPRSSSTRARFDPAERFELIGVGSA